MKDKKQHIDRFFEDKLKGLQPPVSESDWNAILSKMDNAAPKRGWFRWWYTLLIPLLAGIFFMFENTFDQEQTSSLNKKPELTSEKITVELPTAKQNAIKAEAKEELKSKVELPKRRASKISANRPEHSASKDITTKIFNSASSEVSTVNNSVDNQITNSNVPVISDENNSGLKPWTLALKRIQALFDYHSLDLSVPELLTIGQNHPPVNPDAPKPEIKPSFTISPYFGLNRYISNFEAEDPLYETYRKNADHAVWLPDMGVRIQKSKGRITWQSGLIYSEKGQQFKGQTRYMIYDSFPHLDPQGNILGYFRVNYRDTMVTLKNVAKLQYIEIPVNFGMTVNIGKKGTLTGSVGTGISLLTGTKGIVLAENLGLHKSSENALFNYRRWMTSAQTEVKYSYLIYDRFAIGAGIQYKAGLTNIYKNEPFIEKYHQTGGFIELNVRF